MPEWLEKLDRDLLLAINGNHTPFWDQVMWTANEELTWLPLYIFAGLIILYHYGRKGIIMIILAAGLFFVSDQLASNLLRPRIERVRPSHEPGLSEMLHYVNNYRGEGYSFVSSIATIVFSLAFYFYFTLAKARWLLLLIFPWAFLLAISRIYLGVHYPTDIIAAVLIGLLIGWLGNRLYFWILKKFKPLL
ncbi:phosphatase PAP2 family protein [soil metagenome]